MAKRLRCAIYTRKSSEEGLDQAFNSLHAQRDACEAYVLSQAGEGWSAIGTIYDDGGFSGGSMDRPALKALLTDIDSGLVDVVVVYKVDRLTRSLTDFARIVEAFDRQNVSFVSVTQAFNTTTSMGRLTLNVLLSFAQFEREVTGERIRDKIAASKARGMWMGGTVPLGYDIRDRELVINAEEAAVVRLIFEKYMALGSARDVVAELETLGVRTKRWTTRSGKVLGGARFGRGGVFHILQSRLYLGEIKHKGVSHPGKHAALVTPELFEAAADRIRRNAVERSQRPIYAARALLIGKLFDPEGRPMTPTHSYGRGGRLHRYYATRDGSGRKAAPTTICRLSAPAVEGLVHAELQRLLARSVSRENLPEHVRRVELRAEDTLLTLDLAAIIQGKHVDLVLGDIEGRLGPGEKLFRGAGEATILLPRRFQLRGGRRRILDLAGDNASAQAADSIASVLRRAHRLAAENDMAPDRTGKCPVAPTSQYLRDMVTLAFLSPDLQRRVLAGAAPRTLGVRTIARQPLPLAWADQESWFDRVI